MKLCTFKVENIAKLGLVSEAKTAVLDVRLAAGAARDYTEFAGMLSLIDAGPSALDRLNDVAAQAAGSEQFWHPLSEISLLSPLPEPRQIRDFSTFEGHLMDGPQGLLRIHARERGEPEPTRPSSVPQIYRDYPLFYFSNRLNVIGHDADVAWPADVQLLDFELELGACIGRIAKDVSRAEAEQYIFGYTIFNDVSARDIQSRQMPGGMGPCKAKSYDSCNVLGPWIVTRDELSSPYGKMARVRVNGELWAERPITGVVFEFSDMIAFASSGETLYPGEVLGSGTVSGCCGLEIDRWIRKGDVVDLEVEGIGTLRNRYG